MVKYQAKSKLIEDLEELSSFLKLLNEFWESHKPEDIKVVSIYETRPSPTVKVDNPVCKNLTQMGTITKDL